MEKSSSVAQAGIAEKILIDKNDAISEKYEQQDKCVKTNQHGINYMLWFEIGIEGK